METIAPATPLEPRSPSDFSGPAWNTSSEYPSIRSNEFHHDFHDAEHLLSRIDETNLVLKPLAERVLSQQTLTSIEHETLLQQLIALSEFREQAWTLILNMTTYVSCERAVDGKNDEATKAYSRLRDLQTRLDAASKPSSLFLSLAPQEIIDAYLKHPHTAPEAFRIRRAREVADTALSEAEETLLTTMRQHGLHAWSELYDQISSNLRCYMHSISGSSDSIGLAQAVGLLRNDSEFTRKQAWHAIQTAWKSQETTCAAILNNLSGWRLDEYKRRSVKRAIHYLDFPIHYSGLKRETLDAMFSAVEGARPLGQRAMKALAKGLGKDVMDPWDILASAPTQAGAESLRPWKEGVNLIRDAFGAVDSSFADFVDTMEKNRWIEGRVLPAKRQGAYCTRFVKSRTPRVFQTYLGSVSDIRTLAHELGHAYHAWVMRDLPMVRHHYPMTLAESASIFGETAFADHMSASGKREELFEIAWQDAQTAATYLLNIPARFDFERSLYERRSQGQLSPTELGDMTEQAWKKWYGDTLTHMERQFWMTKLHFSMSWMSFYNFPYTFGSLFSLSIYARRNEMGADFLPMYGELLRDTGHMTCEELAQKHLGEDISKPEFWQKSLKIIEGQVARFEKLV